MIVRSGTKGIGKLAKGMREVKKRASLVSKLIHNQERISSTEIGDHTLNVSVWVITLYNILYRQAQKFHMRWLVVYVHSSKDRYPFR